MIIPLSHEDLQSRRWPAVTMAIISLCVAVHVFFVFTGGVERGLHTVRTTGTSLVQYFGEHPYLTPPPDLAERLTSGLSVEERLQLGELRAKGPPPDADVAAEQAELDHRYAAFQAAVGEARLFKYGFVPRRRNWTALFTSMFVHGGWLHLIGNLWMLWLCGCNLEDRWGRRVFTAVYVVAGLAAALLHLAFFRSSSAPLIGASGAIAGAMGGFFVAFLRTRIRLAYFYFPFRGGYGTFTAPAYVMLPLWLGWEVLSGAVFSTSGVAHWAHVGGFLAGAGAAYGLRASGMERKLDAAIEATVTVTQDPRILAAIEHMDQRRPREAIPILQDVLREDAGNIDALLSLLRAASEVCDDALQAEATARLVERYWATGQVDTALSLFEEPRPPSVDERIPRELSLRVARHHASSKAAARAAALCSRLRRSGLIDEVAVRAAVLEAGVKRGMGDLAGARSLLAEARESPFCTFEIDRQIEALAARLEADERARELPLPR